MFVMKFGNVFMGNMCFRVHSDLLMNCLESLFFKNLIEKTLSV